MNFTVQQIAELLDATIIGDATAVLDKLSKIEEGSTGSLSFLSNEKYTSYIYTTAATAVIVNNSFKPDKPVSCILLKVEDSYAAFTKLLTFYNQYKNNKVGVEQPSYIHESVEMKEGFYLGAFAYIGANVTIGTSVKVYPHVFVGDNVTIGNDVTLFAGAKIYSDCVIGNNVVIHAGTVIGSDGFGFAPQADGSYEKVPQTGNVVIEDDVEIGSLTTIDRATLGSTIIRKGAKLDNQIQIAHNVEIGSNTVIAAQTGIAGSVKVGKNCKIGGQVGIAGHITIGNNVGIQAQSGVGRNIKDNQAIQGSPAFNYADWNKSYVHFKNLGKMEQRLTQIEKNS